MRPYYRLFLLLLAALSCRQPDPYTGASVTARDVSSVENARWHLFVNLSPGVENLLDALDPDLAFPSNVSRAHLAGRTDRADFMEVDGSLPAFLYTMYNPGKGWRSLESESSMAIIREGVTPAEDHLPFSDALKGVSDIVAFNRGSGGEWSGLVVLNLGEEGGTVRASFRHGKTPPSTAVELPPSPLVFASGKGAAATSWVLGKRAPGVELKVSPKSAWLKVGKRELLVGERESWTSAESPFTLHVAYDRHDFRLPEGLPLPRRVHRLLQVFDSFSIICENRGSHEECRGEFILKE